MRIVVGFRLRLALFVVTMLVMVQSSTAILLYTTTRQALIAEGERQLEANAKAFIAQMDDVSTRVATSVGVLAQDYGLRVAIAERDRGTVLSVLRNHGRRVGASRMQLVNLDGTLEADTADSQAAGRRFEFADLLEHAFEKRSVAVATLHGKAYWIVAVPVYAPQPVGLVVVHMPLDDAELAHMQRLTMLPDNVVLATQSSQGRWMAMASNDRESLFSQWLGRVSGDFPMRLGLQDIAGHEYMVLAQAPRQPRGSAPVIVVFGYSLDDALRPYRHIALVWSALLAIGLTAGLLGTWLIARNVSRPLEQLAVTAKRIEEGDYRSPPPLRRRDEIGELAKAIGTMAVAVRLREERIRHQATHDAATGLPNRIAIENSIDQAISAGTASGALLMIGLTRVPDIIKTMGHGLCDRLMRDIGKRIHRLIDEGVVARATDSEFVLWLADKTRDGATQVALRVLDKLAAPYTEPDLSIDTVPAIGISMYPENATEAVALLRYAETAQFSAIGLARPLAFYQPNIDPHRPERLSLMSELREAVERNQLELHYQPKLTLNTRQVDAAEALVRWHHPTRGWVSPDQFIGMAEDTGNIQRLTRWVLETAVAQASQWFAQGLGIRVAVNLSARDLGDVHLPQRIAHLVAQHELRPDLLSLEVTERAVIGEPELAIGLLRQLADQGFGIAIDDFGVGQSAFAYLRKLPVNELKIDQSFITHLMRDPNDRIIVRSVVDLSHRLGFKVTAEGVEDQGTLDYLSMIGCDFAQGFFIARPLDADALGDLTAIAKVSGGRA
ncbi:putative bifunctional diguanylate cyclase/phosphodiesterase [Dyella subtropica]|uniref:putative bifunctional diguanylate cyclase/phosphodiesterase n=1 Tax=Dyella subtropica TaxID=2992127 RepID=UPI002255DF1A|nr:EAL domain-containing protein [Dyella subtropica]